MYLTMAKDVSEINSTEAIGKVVEELGEKDIDFLV